MTNTAAAITGANIRSPLSFPGEVHQRGAFLFVIGMLCVRAVREDCLIDACQTQVLPNVPSHHGLPACRIFAPFPASALNTVSQIGKVLLPSGYRSMYDNQ